MTRFVITGFTFRKKRQDVVNKLGAGRHIKSTSEIVSIKFTGKDGKLHKFEAVIEKRRRKKRTPSMMDILR